MIQKKCLVRVLRLFPVVGLRLFLLLLLGFYHAWAGTTGKIAGRALHAESEEPLPSVNIIVVGTTMGAQTDIDGDYFITNISPGVYSIKASIVGFKPVLVTNVKVHVDNTTEINFTMEETILEIEEEIVVTARRPLVEKDNTSTRTIIESSEILSRPTTELTNLLVTLPSINVENGVTKVRGGTLDEVAFMIDGARARNPLNQEAYTAINLSSIQEMEVITGSFNAEYGEAQSGVVNIITKEGSDRYNAFLDMRYEPPGKKHWGPALYDYGTDLYWENAHARHLQWWIDYPDQWVDPQGVPGNDPRCIWTPEMAYENYVATHRPLTDYTNTPGYQLEASFGGPVPFLDKLNFFLSNKYRSKAPLFGNSYRKRGIFYNGTAKLTYDLSSAIKVHLSGFYGTEKTSWGIFEEPDYFYALNFGYTARYAYYDFAGLPESATDGQSLKFIHVLDDLTMYELKLSRVHAFRKLGVFPDDPVGWVASDVQTRDNLRAVDSAGREIVGANNNPIGFNTLGYYHRNEDRNTDWTISGNFMSQFNKNWQFKSGFEFTYYNLDHFNESKLPAQDGRTYNPYQGALYVQSKLEFGHLITNVGLRFDFYDPNDMAYSLFDPFNSPAQETKTFSQLSPRVGIAHPIDERTVLHFSYGHFFQRATFGDYGEGFSEDEQRGSLTTFIGGDGFPWVLGNRNTRPEKTVAFEAGIERNFEDLFVLDVTGYYKDISNTVRGGITVTDINGRIYRTNGNSDYRDVKGFEISLRKLPSDYIWGYINFTTQIGIDGKSGDPRQVRQTDKGIVYGYTESGDRILHNNPRLKAGVFIQTLAEWDFLGGLFNDVFISLEYQAVYPNRKLRQDVFRYSDSAFAAELVRPADENVNLRASKGFKLLGDNLQLRAYIEVRNFLNDKWINFAAIERASLGDQKAFAQSNFEKIPTRDSNGVPILESALYRNLPRSITLGLTVDI